MSLKIKDDYNWNTYTKIGYEKQIIQFLKNGDNNGYGKDMILQNFSFIDNKLSLKDNLHPNWKEIYNQFYNSKANSVFEIGCGCGHHLINIYNINKDTDINGCDYSQSQLDVGKKYFNIDKLPFYNKLFVQDFSIPNLKYDNKYEFVFTHTVIMHLSYKNAKNMLINMGNLSSKYIFLIENWNIHDYDKLLKEALPNFNIIHRPVDKYDYVPYYLLQLK